VSWALLFNASSQPDAYDTQFVNRTTQAVRERVEAIKNYPNIDLFGEYPAKTPGN